MKRIAPNRDTPFNTQRTAQEEICPYGAEAHQSVLNYTYRSSLMQIT